MSALAIICIVIAVILFFGFCSLMCVIIALGILHDEDPERAEEVARQWIERLSRNGNNIKN